MGTIRHALSSLRRLATHLHVAQYGDGIGGLAPSRRSSKQTFRPSNASDIASTPEFHTRSEYASRTDDPCSTI